MKHIWEGFCKRLLFLQVTSLNQVTLFSGESFELFIQKTYILSETKQLTFFTSESLNHSFNQYA